jgi:ADP-heptose:LPS heptosyltransferase
MMNPPPAKRELVKANCRHFIGDRPCKFHKAEGVKCGDCSYYSPVKMRILVVKLGAMGDVLRTTSILAALHKKWEAPHITWITLEESLGLLERNPLVDALMAVTGSSLARLLTETFDLVLNPEAAKESAALASIARGKEKMGFGLSPDGFVFPFNPEAEELFHMGLFDDLKKANPKTYEQLLCHLLNLPYGRIPPVFPLSPEASLFGEAFRSRHRIEQGPPVVGMNTGGGGRWSMKRWTSRGFRELAQRLTDDLGARVILLGGADEAEINRQILSQVKGKIIDAGCSNSTGQFASLLNLCDVVVTGDTLALHLALALRRRVVVLFGPTSAAEIDLYDQGRKLLPEMDCLCCYRQTCERSPTCMESLSSEAVFRAVKEELQILGKC